MTDKRVFIERRPGEGDYAVRKPGSERASAVLPTQAEAIDWAQQRRRGRFRGACSADQGWTSGQVAPALNSRTSRASINRPHHFQTFLSSGTSAVRLVLISPAARSAFKASKRTRTSSFEIGWPIETDPVGVHASLASCSKNRRRPISEIVANHRPRNTERSNSYCNSRSRWTSSDLSPRHVSDCMFWSCPHCGKSSSLRE